MIQNLTKIGSDLSRPECVVSAPDGSIYTSNFGRGITRIHGCGKQEVFEACDARPLGTNGFAMHPDGSFLVADLGERGGVWKLARNGDIKPFLVEVEGQTLPQTNFVHIDRAQRVWITVSTRCVPRDLAFRRTHADGFVIQARIDGTDASIAADGLAYTNEALVDPTGRWLYVNETVGQCLARFPLSDNGLGEREIVHRFEAADFPDGMAFDERGGIWITCIVANRVWRIAPDGDAKVIVGDTDETYCRNAVSAFEADEMDPAQLAAIPFSRLGNVTSICFGGTDRKQAFLGNLNNESIVRFESEYSGVEPSHWKWT